MKALIQPEFALFIGTFTTLLAIINPFEVMPVYLQMLEGADAARHRDVAIRSCVYAAGLAFFFLIFGTLLLRIFGVPLSLVRFVGGIILMKIGFELFSSPGGGSLAASSKGGGNIAFVPLAMPLMFGPGGMATVMGMTSKIRQSDDQILSFAAIAAAIVLTMTVTFFCLLYAQKLTKKMGPMGVDAVTRIVGFFVSAIGAGLLFDGIIETLETHGMTALH